MSNANAWVIVYDKKYRRIVFRFDASRDLIEIKQGDCIKSVDLAQLREVAAKSTESESVVNV